MTLGRGEVAVAGNFRARYPESPPFHPDTAYPEYPFGPARLGPPNATYAAVREALRLLGLDAARYGTPAWNPLGEVIRPGDRVVVKPNAVLDRHEGGGDLFSVVTHPAVIRAMLDYVHIAVGGGSVQIADAPQFNADFDRYLERTGLPEVTAFLAAAGRPVPILDLRRLRAEVDPESGIVGARSRDRRDGDPRGYAVVDLGAESAFTTLPGCERIYGADYDRSVTRDAHLGGRHAYCVARTILEADCVVSMPKLKTHGKVGVTLNLKGLVGINGDKNYVPHFRVGSPEEGGDEYPAGLGRLRVRGRALQRAWIDTLLTRDDPGRERIYRAARSLKHACGRILTRAGVMRGAGVVQDLSAGDWRGNDTAWRMTADLARILLYADPEGRLAVEPRRRFFSVVDGVTAGEGEGPLEPTPRQAGVIVAGFNPAAVDAVGACLMGIDPATLPQLTWYDDPRGAWMRRPPLNGLRVLSDAWDGALDLDALAARSLAFELPSGWKIG